jgi:hypothetical protein
VKNVLDDVAKKEKEYLDRLPKELGNRVASIIKEQTGMLDNFGDVRVAQGKLQDALDAYQQGLAIAKRMPVLNRPIDRLQRSSGFGAPTEGRISTVWHADQGEFRTGDYQDIINKASCLSLVSNAILVWNTLQISRIIDTLG